MANDSKSSLNNMLQAILAPANQEQNMFFPPSVYSSMYNTVTSLLISNLVRAYPSDPTVIDMLAPFVVVEKIPVTDGFIQLKSDYRDILGSPMINVALNKKEVVQGDAEVTPQTFKTANLKAGATRRPVVIVPESEYAYLTTKSYGAPDLANPIGFFSGKNKIFVAPYDIPKVDVMYVTNEPTYRYGYIEQPDGTYIFDESTSVESNWGSNAFTPLYKALSALYAAYSRNVTLRDWSRILNQEGIM